MYTPRAVRTRLRKTALTPRLVGLVIAGPRRGELCRDAALAGRDRRARRIWRKVSSGRDRLAQRLDRIEGFRWI